MKIEELKIAVSLHRASLDDRTYGYVDPEEIEDTLEAVQDELYKAGRDDKYDLQDKLLILEDKLVDMIDEAYGR